MLDETLVNNLYFLYNYNQYLVIDYIVIFNMRKFFKKWGFLGSKNYSINRLLDEVILSNFLIKYFINKKNIKNYFFYL